MMVDNLYNAVEHCVLICRFFEVNETFSALKSVRFERVACLLLPLCVCACCRVRALTVLWSRFGANLVDTTKRMLDLVGEGGTFSSCAA